MGETEPRRIKSVDMAGKILEALRDEQGAAISELTDRLDRSPGTLHTYLATLQAHGLVVKEEDEYRLGPHLVTLGEFVKHHHPLYQAGKTVVDQLADQTDDSVHLLAEHDGQGFVLHERFGEDAVGSNYHAQLREKPYRQLHCRANGKAILAFLPQERVQEIITHHGLAKKGPNAITDETELFEELAEIRDRGYAFNDEEELRGVRAVGAPILDAENHPIGAISLSASQSRLRGERFRETVPELVLNSANEIEVNIETENFEP